MCLPFAFRECCHSGIIGQNTNEFNDVIYLEFVCIVIDLQNKTHVTVSGTHLLFWCILGAPMPRCCQTVYLKVSECLIGKQKATEGEYASKSQYNLNICNINL